MFRRKSETKSAADLVSEMAAELDKTLPAPAEKTQIMPGILSDGKLMLFHVDSVGNLTRLASTPVNITRAIGGVITVTFQVTLS